MNQSVEDQAECPLCLEPFEVDDVNFFPCTCGYQICRFCWHRIRTNENGLCPACRKAYEENPADFKPLSQEQVAKLKAEKRQKEQQRKQKATESRKHLANVRVVQKNLVFVVGLPIRLADANVLKKHEYFGKFGKIHKVVINQSTSYAGATGPSASAYVTYNKCDDALRAIQSVNNICVDNRILKTSLGTTKYCSHFIKTQTCPKQDCMYLHDLGDAEASFTKEEMQQGKHQEYEKKLHEQLNNSLSRERKSTPSPPNSSTTTIREGWPTLQNGTITTTAALSLSTTIPTNSSPPLADNTETTDIICNNNTSSTNKQNSKNKEKNKEKMNGDSKTNNCSHNSAGGGNNRRKGKEKQTSDENKDNDRKRASQVDVTSGGGDLITSKSDNSIDTRLTTTHRSSLFEPDNNSFFSSNNFSKLTSGLRDGLPQNGFIKLTDNNMHTKKKDETSSETLIVDKENQLNDLGSNNTTQKVLTNGYLQPQQQQQPKDYSYQNGVGSTSGSSNHSSVNFQNNQNIFHNFLTSSNQKLMKEDLFINPNVLGQQTSYIMKQHEMPVQQQQQQQQANLYIQQHQQYNTDSYRNLNLNGLNSQHLNYLQQNYANTNLRDHLLLQKQANYLNNYNNSSSTSYNSFSHHHHHNHCNDELNDKSYVNGYYGSDKDNDDMLQNRINDDDLGFDPFHETQKALADIIEQETQMRNTSTQALFGQHRSFNNQQQLQINLLNQQNHMIGSKILSQFQPQQLMPANQRLTGMNCVDGMRSTLPPPGFTNPTAQQPQQQQTHNFSLGSTLSRNNITNGDAGFQSHYLVNGISKSAGEWPDTLRSLLPDNNPSPTTSGTAPNFTSLHKGWSPVTNCTDWTTLDPAIVSSRPHNPAQSLLSNQDFSQIHQNQFQTQMSQLQIGNMIGQQNWLHRQQQQQQQPNDDVIYCKTNWSGNSAAPPPGFNIRQNSPELKKQVNSIVDSL